MDGPQHLYRVEEVVKVTDGDTYWVRLDVGFRQTLLINARLQGWDCPELRASNAHERDAGKEARTFAEVWFRAASDLTVWVTTEKDPDSFGRWLATFTAWDSKGREVSDIGEFLAIHALATPWPQRWREVYGT